eukprot:jgi/Ulvmu1/8375/UM042_0081.1
MDRDDIPDHGPGGNAGEDDLVDEAVPNEEEDEADGEDLLDENMWNDYRHMPDLDRYDADGIDENDNLEELSDGARLAVEEELDRRDRRARGDLPAAFEEEEDEASMGENARARRAGAVRGRQADAGMPDSQMTGSEADDLMVHLDAGNVRGNLADWIQTDPVQSQIRRTFAHFLETYQDEASTEGPVYETRILDMVQANRQSLDVDFVQLSRHTTALAIWTVDAPQQMLQIFNAAAEALVDRRYKNYRANVHESIYVRMTGLPVVENLRDIRHSHLNTLVKVTGVVTRRTGVYPQMSVLYYICRTCGNQLGPLMQSGDADVEIKPQQCTHCESRGPFDIDQHHTVYRNYQKITLQESPGSVPSGRLPRSKNIILLNDLIDIAKPGEQVEVTGVYQHSYESALNAQTGFPVFATSIEANHIRSKADNFSLDNMTEDALAEIQRLSRDRHIAERIMDSIAPSIYGHTDIKACLALALFGGQEKLVGSHRLRGDINVLLIGDPGTAKSQFLKYVEKTAARAVYTTGKGASAVGLTATVTKDPVTREWTLEGGALVLADRGICLIDEFDKMNDHDRVSIHEAMEQQSISISKAGIVTSLRARCSVIAAANPDNGRYDPSRTFNENVRSLTDPIISRFDCLCVVKDQVDPQLDERLARFVVQSHHHSHPANDMDELQRAAAGEAAAAARPGQAANTIDQELLRMYIAYAKKNCHPKLQDADTAKMVQVYIELRREAGMTHAMPVAVRHLESMIRMSEAHARMHLRDKVEPQDIDIAIRLMLESFIQAQKYNVQKQLRRRFQRFMAAQSDYNNLLLTILRGMGREAARMAAMTHGEVQAQGEVEIDRGRFEERAADYCITAVDQFYECTLFRENGFNLAEDGGRIVMAQ